MEPIEKLARLREFAGHLPAFVQARFQHFEERMAERFNSRVTYEEWEELNLRIFLDGDKAEWVDCGSDTSSSLYRVTFRGEDMLVAYSDRAYVVMTVYPRGEYRLMHLRAGTYERKAQSDADTVNRDIRRGLAATFDSLEEDEQGRLIKADEPAAQSPEPKPANPFVAALANFTPSSPTDRPVLSRPVPVLVPTPPPADDLTNETAAAFAQLNKHLDRQAADLDAEQGERDDEVAELERRLAALKNGDPVLAMKREIVADCRAKVEQTFEGWRAGTFDAASALSIARLFLAHQPAPAAKAATMTHARPTSLSGKKLEDIPLDGPPHETFKRGVSQIYRLDGIEANQGEWGRFAGLTGNILKTRLEQGWTFREALHGMKFARKAVR